MWEENKLYYIINIHPLLYHWDTYKMAFLLLSQVKHVKLIGFFSWLIGRLFGWQNFNPNQVKTKEKSTFWQFPGIIFFCFILLSFIKSPYIKLKEIPISSKGEKETL